MGHRVTTLRLWLHPGHHPAATHAPCAMPLLLLPILAHLHIPQRQLLDLGPLVRGHELQAGRQAGRQRLNIWKYGSVAGRRSVEREKRRTPLRDMRQRASATGCGVPPAPASGCSAAVRAQSSFWRHTCGIRGQEMRPWQRDEPQQCNTNSASCRRQGSSGGVCTARHS